MFNLNLRMSNRKTTLAYYFGMLGFIYALYNWSWVWFALSIVVHITVISVFSAVIHRYFCHKAYSANPTLMWILSFIPSSYAYATPVSWASLHAAHHAYSDTVKDPHIKGLISLVSAAYRMPPMKFMLHTKWFYNKKHELLHKNAALVFLLSGLGWFLVGWDYFIWVFMVPLFTLHFSNGLHRTFSHTIYGKEGATSRWWLEYIVPMGGEWIHKEHHEDATKARFSNRWYEIDTGWWIIKLLSKPGTARTSRLYNN